MLFNMIRNRMSKILLICLTIIQKVDQKGLKSMITLYWSQKYWGISLRVLRKIFESIFITSEYSFHSNFDI